LATIPVRKLEVSIGLSNTNYFRSSTYKKAGSFDRDALEREWQWANAIAADFDAAQITGAVTLLEAITQKMRRRELISAIDLFGQSPRPTGLMVGYPTKRLADQMHFSQTLGEPEERASLANSH
jgi:hypothetical protein